VSRVFAAAATLAALLGLIGQAGRWLVQADVINFVAIWWLAIGMAAGLLALLLRPGRTTRGLAGWSMIVLGLVAAALFGPDLRAGRTCAGPPLAVAQLNMFLDNPDPRPATAWLRTSGADVLLVMEAAATVRSELSDVYPFQMACAAGCSTLILSRYPFRSAGGLARNDPENRLGLSAVWAEVAHPAGPFTAVAAHFDRPWPFNGNGWNRASLAQFVATRDRATTIVGGDFNLPAGSFQAQALERGLGLERVTRSLSWPAPHPVMAIDHLFAGVGWAVERSERGPPLGSDHYPILTRLRRCA
jgi:endonuclease/exonuclease/phosphatase (EEP) superfamily protein YafD